MLPLVDEQTSPGEALRVVMGTGKSGLLVRTTKGVRLVHRDALVAALDTKALAVGRIKDFEPVAIRRRDDWDPRGEKTFALWTGRARGGTARFAVLARGRRRGLAIVTVRSHHEPFADRYLVPPLITKCGNPNEDHFYPPLTRDPQDPATCYCGFSIP